MTYSLWRLHLETTSQLAELYGEVLESRISEPDISEFKGSESLSPQILAVSWYEIDEDKNHWILEATIRSPMDSPPDSQVYQEILLSVGQNEHSQSLPIHLELLPETDWLEQTWESFPPRQVGPFYIYGSHTQTVPPADLIGLEINAATAFGSGEHETTSGCLMALSDLKEQGMMFTRPLDMGCGSGILAMAIAKLWGVSVLAVDNDPESVRVTLSNAQMNGCATFIEGVCNEGFEGEVVQSHGPFDLVTANILANPLCLMAASLVQTCQPGARIILSGLLTRQKNDVVSAYEVVGATLVGEKIIGDWSTLILQKL